MVGCYGYVFFAWSGSFGGATRSRRSRCHVAPPWTTQSATPPPGGAQTPLIGLVVSRPRRGRGLVLRAQRVDGLHAQRGQGPRVSDEVPLGAGPRGEAAYSLGEAGCRWCSASAAGVLRAVWTSLWTTSSTQCCSVVAPAFWTGGSSGYWCPWSGTAPYHCCDTQRYVVSGCRLRLLRPVVDDLLVPAARCRRGDPANSVRRICLSSATRWRDDGDGRALLTRLGSCSILMGGLSQGARRPPPEPLLGDGLG